MHVMHVKIIFQYNANVLHRFFRNSYVTQMNFYEIATEKRIATIIFK